jgi:hypothetical protein
MLVINFGLCLAAPILLLLKSRFATLAALVAALDHALFIVLTTALRDRVARLGVQILIQDIVTCALTLLFAAYSAFALRRRQRKGEAR